MLHQNTEADRAQFQTSLSQISQLQAEINNLKTQINSQWIYPTPSLHVSSTYKTELQTFPLPIPATAKKILVQAFVQSGGCVPSDLLIESTVFTIVNNVKQIRFLEEHCYNQNSWSFYSDSMELDVDGSNLNLYVQSNNILTTPAAYNLNLLAYK